MKFLLRSTLILIFIFVNLSCYETQETNNKSVKNKKELINIQEEINIGNKFYDKDDYINALPHFLYAFEAGKEDGIILYRIAYSFEQICGLTHDIQNIYRYAFKLLERQYPNHKYYKYAKNKIIRFSSININKIFIAENGDIYNFDNDGDGRREPVYVRGYFRKDGTYVRGHYRAKPR